MRVESLPAACVGAVGSPVSAGEASGAFKSILDCRPVSRVRTNAVVAIAVLLLPLDGVGAVGLPVSAGEALGAFSLSNSSSASCTLVLLIEPDAVEVT
jgi:hypothetical protein